MKLAKTTSQFLPLREKVSGDVGLVPTMGNLHKGHLALIEKSLGQNPWTIVTIFVNPKQFGPQEDFEKYPQTLKADIQKIEELLNSFSHRKLILYAPQGPSEVFPSSFATEISVKSMRGVLCDKFRPGHFDGVTTVVYQLFLLCRPHRAYFGEKDYQQFKIIERMALDLAPSIQLITIPTVREPSGLALSSRNQYLNERELKAALRLPQALELIARPIGDHSLSKALEEAQRICREDPDFQYLEVLDAKNLAPASPETQKLLIAGALTQGTTRLIDNRLLSLKHA